MRIASKKDIIIFVSIGLFLLTVAFFYFWPVSNTIKEKMGIAIESTSSTTSQLVEGDVPKVIQLNSNKDKIYRCIYPLGGYNVIRNIPDGGSGLYNNKGDLLCRRGGIDPAFQQGNCQSVQLCFPVYDK